MGRRPTPPQELARNRPRRSSVSSTFSVATRTSSRVPSDSPITRTGRASSRKKKYNLAERASPEDLEDVTRLGQADAVEGHPGKKNVEIVDKVQPKLDDGGEGVASGSDDEDDEDESEEDGVGTVEALGEGFYEVETVKRKRVRKGEVQYLIKWRGWPDSANTWEPFDNVKACADIIEEFEKSYAGKQGRRGRSKRKFGTYLLPPKKKRSFPLNAEEGNDANIRVDSMENEGLKRLRSEAEEISPEKKDLSLPGGETSDPGRQAGKDDETRENPFQQLTVSEASKDVVVFDSIGNQQGSGHVMILKSGVPPNKQALENPSSSVGGEAGSPSLSVGREIDRILKENCVQDTMDNDHHDVKEESRVTQGGSFGQQLSLPSGGAVQKNKSPNKEVAGNSSISRPEKKTSGELGKASSNDKCTGAKKRKQGFVRRVKQSLDFQEQDTKATPHAERPIESAQVLEQGKALKGSEHGIQEGKKDQLGAQHLQPQTHEPKAPVSPQGTPFDPPSGPPVQITKIIKAVNYSNSSVCGKQDVVVLFKALRADGREVLVDNKFMRANYPLLLIEFYEQHLRYSPSTIV